MFERGVGVVSLQVQIRQREHRPRSRLILGAAAVTCLGQAPQPLDHPKGMFALRASPRALGAELAQVCPRPLSRRASTIDPLVYPGTPGLLAMRRVPVRVVAAHLALFTMRSSTG